MSDQAFRKRPSNAPPVDGPMQRRLKLAVFILIFGPMVLFGLYHMTLGVYKMFAGEHVGYRSPDQTTQR
ncbi:MAG: hypothetical protein ACYTGC_15305 [Planctomycetota bacterium]|jgi:hypothetical protein